MGRAAEMFSNTTRLSDALPVVKTKTINKWCFSFISFTTPAQYLGVPYTHLVNYSATADARIVGTTNPSVE